jgi:hypothetical protein
MLMANYNIKNGTVNKYKIRKLYLSKYLVRLKKLSYSVSSIFKKSLKIPKGNQNPYIEEEQTTQWPKVKVQEDKQQSTKHTHKTKDRVTRNYPEMENTIKLLVAYLSSLILNLCLWIPEVCL